MNDDNFRNLGQIGQQAQEAQQAPGLLQMAQDAMGNVMSGEQAFSSLPKIGTFEGDRSAWEYARYLELADKLRQDSNNPNFQLDRDRQDAFAKAGANYARGNNISYDTPALQQGMPQLGRDGWGGEQSQAVEDSGFHMDGKPMALSGVQGDAGRQLNRLPAALRNAFGPSVVQHIMDVGGGSGSMYPGSLAYMLGVPNTFEAGDSFRLNRDAWGRGFGVGSVDSMILPMSMRPRP